MAYRDVLIGHIRYDALYDGPDWTRKVGQWVRMYSDRRLFLTERQVINSPSADTNLVKVPGSSNIIDLSEALTGFPTYGTRKIRMTFAVSDTPERFPLRYDEAVNDFNGKRFDLIFEDDPGYYYSGRFEVNALESDRRTGKIVIEAECDPYKLEITKTNEEWLWDPFDFTNGVIREYGDMTIDEETTIDVIACGMPVRPTVVTDGTVVLSVKKNNVSVLTQVLQAGTHTFPGFVLRSDGTGVNDVYKFTFTPGEDEDEVTVSVVFRGGRL